jgi:hypothetical protein
MFYELKRVFLFDDDDDVGIEKTFTSKGIYQGLM